MRGGQSRDGSAGAGAELQAFLQSLFACTAEVARGIALRAALRGYPIKAVILAQGEQASVTFLVVAGRAHAIAYSAEGRLVLLQEFRPGDFFGAIAQAEASLQESDVVAVEAVRAALFQAVDFLQLAEVHACIGVALSRMLLRQLRAANARMAERTTLSAAGRVCAELLRLARLADGRTVSPAPVLSALAVRVNSTRETVSRTISDLQRRGLVRRDRKALVIVAPDRLEDMTV
ncbi:MAG TPA: Crp/Fnr family transcriptional regulator [Rhizomicrobium sp.]|nr:Crp/Fnr family transcriptional regulator [Rhizomicrobium sp.]